MKIGGQSSLLVLALASLLCMCSAIFFGRADEEERPTLVIKGLRIFSKPPETGDKNTSPTFLPYLGNVLNGGSLGIELTPFGFAQGILGQARRVIPGSRTVIGRPSNEEPPEDWEIRKPKKEDSKESDSEEEEPKKRPSWEDIGETTEIAIEDIIQPRRRPKRFVESKIYHVPLLYRSNGRPYQVKIKSRNGLDESKHERD